MALTNESLELLKTDTGGRVRATPERREALLDEFERGGLSGMRFAARYGLKYPTFANWVARRRRERMEAAREPERKRQSDSARAVRERASAPVPAKPQRWLEAVADNTGAEAGPAPAQGVMLHLPGGVRMEVAHADQAALAAALMRAFSAGILPAGGGGGHGGASSLRVPTSSFTPSC
ncbi:MAG: hypothetical protein V4726_17340 [Verrucomicrobiota bacterium]